MKPETKQIKKPKCDNLNYKKKEGLQPLCCFTHSPPLSHSALAYRARPWHRGWCTERRTMACATCFAVDRGVVNVFPVFGRVAVKWQVCAWPASPSQRRPWHLEPGRGTAGTWCTETGGRWKRLPWTQKTATVAAADKQRFWFPRVCLATSHVIVYS